MDNVLKALERMAKAQDLWQEQLDVVNRANGAFGAIEQIAKVQDHWQGRLQEMATFHERAQDHWLNQLGGASRLIGGIVNSQPIPAIEFVVPRDYRAEVTSSEDTDAVEPTVRHAGMRTFTVRFDRFSDGEYKSAWVADESGNQEWLPADTTDDTIMNVAIEMLRRLDEGD